MLSVEESNPRLQCEIVDSTIILLPQEQRKAYSEEMKTLEATPLVKSESEILKLYPFLDDSKRCVGGRIAHTLTFLAKTSISVWFRKVVIKPDRLRQTLICRHFMEEQHKWWRTSALVFVSQAAVHL